MNGWQRQSARDLETIAVPATAVSRSLRPDRAGGETGPAANGQRSGLGRTDRTPVLVQ
jgi:hypothetical protein